MKSAFPACSAQSQPQGAIIASPCLHPSVEISLKPTTLFEKDFFEGKVHCLGPLTPVIAFSSLSFQEAATFLRRYRLESHLLKMGAAGLGFLYTEPVTAGTPLP